MPTLQTTIIPGKTSLEQIYKWTTATPDYVRVGLPDTPHPYANLTIAELGAIHEFGIPGHIPERPFLHSGIREGADQIARLSQILLFQLQNGEITKDTALIKLGQLGADLVKDKIRRGPFKDLAESTKQKRRYELNKPHMDDFTPLIDSGEMRQSVTFETER